MSSRPRVALGGTLVAALALGAAAWRASSGLPVPTEAEHAGPAELPDAGDVPAPRSEEVVGPPIVDHLLPYGDERTRATVAYLRYHVGADFLTGDDLADTTLVPRVIVLHWTAGPTARSAWNEFASERTRKPGVEPEMAVNTSAHFLVDRDGTIYRLVPEDRVARHAIGLNHVAIGVENVGGTRRWPLTPAQVDANIALVRYLAARFPITHLVGHYETGEMRGGPLYRELDPDYRSQKVDPGPEFMGRVREGVADLGLRGPR
ncbi:MAG: N-acetylmuramoyl-L-alanine amidase [Alphaproteobacteria bacterium]|nr:N-acetylmuramoyl-L-alanine amidase [Alphaproteobacteria bacterium]